MTGPIPPRAETGLTFAIHRNAATCAAMFAGSTLRAWFAPPTFTADAERTVRDLVLWSFAGEIPAESAADGFQEVRAVERTVDVRILGFATSVVFEIRGKADAVNANAWPAWAPEAHGCWWDPVRRTWVVWFELPVVSEPDRVPVPAGT